MIMLIKMDTRPVGAFKLTISSNHNVLFEDVIFSKADVKIDLPDFRGGTLVLNWSFRFEDEEKEKLKARTDFPKEGLNSYYIENDVDGGSDKFLIGSFMESAAEGVYYTIVEKIMPSCNTLRLAFVETTIAGGLLLLDVSSKGSDKFGKSYFKRRENVEEYLRISKQVFARKLKSYRRFTSALNLTFVGWLLLWSEILGEFSFSTFALTFLLGGFTSLNYINYCRQKKSYKEFVRDCMTIGTFTLSNGKIEVMETL